MLKYKSSLDNFYYIIVVILFSSLNVKAQEIPVRKNKLIESEMLKNSNSNNLLALGEQPQFELMRKNFRDKITLGIAYDLDNDAVKKHINSIASNATSYWNNMEKNPVSFLWSDYNKLKNDATNTPKHVYYSYLRLLEMAKAFAYEGSSLYKNADLLSDIIDALSFMYSYAYNESTVRIGNFWEWRMGIPDSYARIISILYDEIPQTTIDSYSNAIIGHVRNFTVNGNYTFGNQATICKSLFYCGVLSGNMDDIQIALDNLVRAFVDNTTITQRKNAQIAFENLWKDQGDYHNYSIGMKEGFYEDGTFIQHIAIPYIGGYGKEVTDASAKMAEVLDGTGISLPVEIQKSLLGWFDKAFFPTIYEGEMMMMFMGRNVTKNPHEIARSIVLDIFESVFLVENEDSRKRVMEVCKRMFKQNNYYSDVYSGLDPIVDKPRIDKLMNNINLSVAQNTPFNIVMAAGDRVIHNRPDFRFGISMSSSRIGKFESSNSANTQGWYTGDGMTYIYNNDRAHYVGYFRNVNPKRLPGTTVDVIDRVAQTSSNYGLFGIPTNAKDWVGGVSLLGKYGTAGMHLVGQVSNLEAKKSWFMFDDEIVALGAGIKLTENRKVETIIENRRSSNSLYVDGIEKSQSRGWSENLNNVSWIHLDGTSGYYFPENSSVSCFRDYNGFTQLYLDHGISPNNEKYAYVLCPSKSKEFIVAYSDDPDIQILANTEKVQAVYEKRLDIFGVNFWEAGSIDIIESKSAASVMLQRKRDTIYLSIADPTWKLNTQQIVLNGNYELASAEKGKVIVSKTGTTTNILLNSIDRMGKAHEIVLLDKNYSSNLDIVSIKPNLRYKGNSIYSIDNLPLKGASIEVYNMFGEEVLFKRNDETTISVDLSPYNIGIYIIMCKVNENESSYVWKCIKT